MPKFLVFFYFLFFSFLCYSQQNNIDSLERQLNKSDISEIVRTLNLLSVRLFDTLPVKALLYAEEAMKLAEQQNNQEGKMVALKNIGLVYKHQKENKKAIEFFMQSLELSQRLQNTSECAKISRELGFCYQNVSENDKAIEFLIASLSFPNMSQKNKLSIDEFFSKGSVYNKLSEIYIQKNDYKNAYNYSQLYQSLMDSIRNEKNQNQLDEMIGKYESEKQLYKIDIQKIELEKKETELTKRGVERNALIFLLALVIGILIYVLYSQRQRRFIMKKLRSQNIEIKQQKEEISAQTEHLTEINEKLEYLSIVASKTDSAIAIFDEVGNLEWVNEGVTRLYGYDLHQLKRERGTNIIKISSYPNISELFRQAQTEKRTIIYESVFTARDGGKIYSHTTLTPVLDIEGHIIRFVAIDSDISKLKKVEEKLQSQHDELQKLNATKDRLFSIIAHDLKNPFYSLIGFTDILLAQYKELSDEQKIEILNIINSSSKEAHYLLENLLIWSRSQTHKIFINKASHNLSHLIQQNIDLLKGSAEKKQIKISANLDSTINIFVDKDMINTVLRNLISNGIKFTFEGGQIIIETKRIESRVEISVKDTGIGIKEEKIDKLFKLDQFQTTTGTSNETGTGLGLIISKEFTEANGGQIFATSEPGIGSTFYVILLCI